MVAMLFGVMFLNERIGWRRISAILVGFVILIWSADLFVAGAASIAENMGLSPTIIGLTIVAIGTSLPELAAAVAAGLKKQSDMAIEPPP